MPYAPTATETIVRNPHSAQGTFTVELLDPSGDSTTQTVNIQLPANLSLNPALDPCLAGETCTAVGTISGTSPVLPAGQLNGTITLKGTMRSPALGIRFSAPTNLQLGSSLSTKALVLDALPDIPMSSLTLNFTGNPLGRLFVTECYENAFGATFSPTSGIDSVLFNGALVQKGCTSGAHPAKHKQRHKAKPKKRKSHK
jgi:hypothetical protein